MALYAQIFRHIWVYIDNLFSTDALIELNAVIDSALASESTDWGLRISKGFS